VSLLFKPCLPSSSFRFKSDAKKETAAVAVPRRTKPQQQQQQLNNYKKLEKVLLTACM